MIKSLDDLNQVRQQYSDLLALREHRSAPGPRMNIMVCGGTGCLSSDSDKVVKNLELILKARGYADEVKVVRTGCFGFVSRVQ